MQRYIVNKFDSNTFVVIDQTKKKEICICSNYDEHVDAEERANFIASLLNKNL